MLPGGSSRANSGVRSASLKGLCQLGCAGVALLIVLGAIFSLSIAAVVIESKYGSNQCIGTYKGIDFNYGVWLKVYGWTNIALAAATLTIGVCVLVAQSSDDSCAGGCVVTLVIFHLLFQFCWYIVGAILFFTTVSSDCDQGQPLYQFGLALFIIQTISWASICFGKKSE